jgi:hypothetical protein
MTLTTPAGLNSATRNFATKPHIVYPETPMTNLYLSMLDKMGVHTEKLGDSTGETTHLADV